MVNTLERIVEDPGIQTGGAIHILFPLCPHPFLFPSFPPLLFCDDFNVWAFSRSLWDAHVAKTFGRGERGQLIPVAPYIEEKPITVTLINTVTQFTVSRQYPYKMFPIATS